MGMYCDSCDPLHYDLDSGCLHCNCLLQGTLDGVAACNPQVKYDSRRCPITIDYSRKFVITEWELLV